MKSDRNEMNVLEREKQKTKIVKKNKTRYINELCFKYFMLLSSW